MIFISNLAKRFQETNKLFKSENGLADKRYVQENPNYDPRVFNPSPQDFIKTVESEQDQDVIVKMCRNASKGERQAAISHYQEIAKNPEQKSRKIQAENIVYRLTRFSV